MLWRCLIITCADERQQPVDTSMGAQFGVQVLACGAASMATAIGTGPNTRSLAGLGACPPKDAMVTQDFSNCLATAFQLAPMRNLVSDSQTYSELRKEIQSNRGPCTRFDNHLKKQWNNVRIRQICVKSHLQLRNTQKTDGGQAQTCWKEFRRGCSLLHITSTQSVPLSLKEAVSNPHEICLAPLGIVGEHLRIVLQDVSSICKY